MTNFEGRKTDRDNKQDFIYFDVDDDFVGDGPETSTSPCSTEPRERRRGPSSTSQADCRHQ